MARLAKWITVCDEGGERCDNTDLHRVRLTIDGKTKISTVCAKHLAPWLKLRDRGKTAPQKGRVYDSPADAKNR